MRCAEKKGEGVSSKGALRKVYLPRVMSLVTEDHRFLKMGQKCTLKVQSNNIGGVCVEGERGRDLRSGRGGGRGGKAGRRVQRPSNQTHDKQSTH